MAISRVSLSPPFFFLCITGNTGEVTSYRSLSVFHVRGWSWCQCPCTLTYSSVGANSCALCLAINYSFKKHLAYTATNVISLICLWKLSWIKMWAPGETSFNSYTLQKEVEVLFLRITLVPKFSNSSGVHVAAFSYSLLERYQHKL